MDDLIEKYRAGGWQGGVLSTELGGGGPWSGDGAKPPSSEADGSWVDCDEAPVPGGPGPLDVRGACRRLAGQGEGNDPLTLLLPFLLSSHEHTHYTAVVYHLLREEVIVPELERILRASEVFTADDVTSIMELEAAVSLRAQEGIRPRSYAGMFGLASPLALPLGLLLGLRPPSPPCPSPPRM